MSKIRDQLKQAQALIKQGDNQGAIDIIKPILRENKNLASAWWLLANALTDSDQQKHALQQVLRIRPNEPRAEKMLAKLNTPKKDDFGFDDPFAVFDALDDTPYPAPVEADPPKQAKQSNDPFAMFDQFDVDEDDDYSVFDNDDDFSAFDNDDDDPFSGVNAVPLGIDTPAPQKHRAKRSRRPLLLLLLLVIIIGVGVAVFVIMNQDASSRPASTGFCADNSDSIVNCAQMQIGQRWEGELTANQEHYWTFQAQANQHIRIDAEGLTSSTDTVLQLHAPDGILLMSNDDILFPENVNSRVEGILPSAGEYRIVVSTFGRTAGRYSLHLQELTTNTTSDNSIGCPAVQIVCGEIAIDGEVTGQLNGDTAHSWTFSGERGQQITITVIGLNNLDTIVSLFNEAGTPLDFNDDIDFENGNLSSEIPSYALPETGTYRIEVGTIFGGGDYRLSVRLAR